MTAHFIQPDTIVPEAGGSKAYYRYGYVNNNPVRYNDPSGHCPLCVSAAAGAGIGAVTGGVAYGIYLAISGNEFNWGHLALAAGGGAAAGALIGTGIGWAAGVTQAAATSAAITGAGAASTTATTVLTATGGDPTDEINVIKQVVQGTGPAVARAIGRAGEAASGIAKNTLHIESLTQTAKYLIPDGLNLITGALTEVKNVAYQGLSTQSTDYLLYSQKNNYTFTLITRTTTKLSLPLQKIIDQGKIILQRMQ